MDWQAYSEKSAAALLRELGSSKKGLSLAEAHKRLKSDGPNRLAAAHTNRLKSFVKDLCGNTFFLILLAATAISVYLGDGYSALALLVVMVLNAVSGAVYSDKNYRFVRHLEQLLTRQVTVVRSGKRQQIDSSQLVTGDIVCLEQDEFIPADLRLIEAEKFATGDYYPAGGETEIVQHSATGAASVVFMGAQAVSGSARGVVVATGSRTYAGQLVGSPDTLSAITGVPARGLLLLRSRLGWTAIGAAAVLIVLSLAGHLEFRNFWQCLAALAVAAVPTELVAALAISRRAVPAATGQITACAVHNVSAKLGLAGLGIIGLIVFHVPMAITIIGLLIIDIVGVLLPASAIDNGGEKSGSHAHLIGSGLFAAGLAYAGFLLYFEARGLSPVRLDANSTLYFQASMLACLTVILCQFASIMLIRADGHEHFFTHHLRGNNHLLVAMALSLAAILFIIYSPLAHHYLRSGTLGWSSWGTAVLAAAIYTCLRLLQRRTRHHSRAALLRDHSPETLRKHPKLA